MPGDVLRASPWSPDVGIIMHNPGNLCRVRYRARWLGLMGPRGGTPRLGFLRLQRPLGIGETALV